MTISIELSTLTEVIIDAYVKGDQSSIRAIRNLREKNEDLTEKLKRAADRIDSLTADQWTVVRDVLDTVFRKYLEPHGRVTENELQEIIKGAMDAVIKKQ